MDKILSAMGPLMPGAGLAGLALCLTVWLFRGIIQRNIFPTLTKQHAYEIIRLIIVATALLAAAGLAAWVYDRGREQRRSVKPVEQLLGDELVVLQKNPTSDDPIDAFDTGFVLEYPSTLTATFDEGLSAYVLTGKPGSVERRYGFRAEIASSRGDVEAFGLRPVQGGGRAVPLEENAYSYETQKAFIIQSGREAGRMFTSEEHVKLPVLASADDEARKLEVDGVRLTWYAEGRQNVGLAFLQQPPWDQVGPPTEFAEHWLICSAPTDLYRYVRATCDQLFDSFQFVAPTYFAD